MKHLHVCDKSAHGGPGMKTRHYFYAFGYKLRVPEWLFDAVLGFEIWAQNRRQPRRDRKEGKRG